MQFGITQRLQSMRRARDTRRREVSIGYGEQDPMDIISYAGLEETPDHLLLDG